MSVPLATLNLRYNPFGELLPYERARVAVGDFASLAQQLARPGTAIQLRGACGRGKSTHLFGLLHQLPEAQYSRIDRGGPVSRGGVYLMDEADHVGPLRRWWYLRRATSVAVATHHDMSRFLRLCGFRVVDVGVARTDAEQVRRIAEQRIALAWTGEGTRPELSVAHARALVEQFGDDVRRMEDALYDWILEGANGAL